MVTVELRTCLNKEELEDKVYFPGTPKHLHQLQLQLKDNVYTISLYCYASNVLKEKI